MLKAEFSHLSVVIEDLDEAIRFFSETFGLVLPSSGPWSKVNQANEPGFKTKYAFLQMNGGFLELVEPIEGPRVRILEERGEGAIYLITFRVEDIEKAYDEMREKGMTPVDWHGSPLIDRKYIFVAGTGSKLFFLPREKTFGIYIELIEPAV